MTNPNELPVNPHSGLHINQNTGEPVIRRPAGGLGGGVTSSAETPASSEQHLRHLESEVGTKEAELEDAMRRHEAARSEHERPAREQREREAKREAEARAAAEQERIKQKAAAADLAKAAKDAADARATSAAGQQSKQ